MGSGKPEAIGFGRHVYQGQVLAVIWSRDLGEKKSELVDGLSQLRVDEESLAQIAAGGSLVVFVGTQRQAQAAVEREALRCNMPFVSEITPLLIVTKLEQYDYAGATAIAVVMLLISFVLILAINLLQRWQSRRGQ